MCKIAVVQFFSWRTPRRELVQLNELPKLELSRPRQRHSTERALRIGEAFCPIRDVRSEDPSAQVVGEKFEKHLRF
jgi:hypothetical protein